MTGTTLLPALLADLLLPSIARNWKRITEVADREGWPAEKLLTRVMEIEVSERASRRIQRYRDQSEAPAGKTFANFDFKAAQGVRYWIKDGDNLLVFGQSGTGKSHALAAICHTLIDAGTRVLFNHRSTAADSAP